MIIILGYVTSNLFYLVLMVFEIQLCWSVVCNYNSSCCTSGVTVYVDEYL